MPKRMRLWAWPRCWSENDARNALELTLGVQRLVDALLRQAQRERRPLGDAAGHGHDERAQVIGCHHLVDHAQSVRVRRGDPVAGEEQFLGLPRTELPGMGEVLDTVHTHADHGIAEQCVVGGDDDVGDPEQHQAACDRLALRGGDHRLGDVAPPPAHLEVQLLLPGEVTLLPGGAEATVGRHEIELGEVLSVAQVVSAAEVRTVGLEHDHLDILAPRRVVERGVEFVGHPLVLGVAAGRSIESDHRDAGRPWVDDLVVDRRQLFERDRHRLVPPRRQSSPGTRNGPPRRAGRDPSSGWSSVSSRIR